jgi:hypothetical protein
MKLVQMPGKRRRRHANTSGRSFEGTPGLQADATERRVQVMQ